MVQGPDQIAKEAEIVNEYLAKFIASETGTPDDKKQLLWHNAGVEYETTLAIQEVAMNVHTKLATGRITPDQAVKEQTVMLEITMRAMLYAGFQMAKDGVELTPCDCPRFLPGEQVKVTPEVYRAEVASGEREPGNYL